MKNRVWEISTTEYTYTISSPTASGKAWESLTKALWSCDIRTQEAVKTVKHIYEITGSVRGKITNWQQKYLQEIQKRD